MSDDNHQKKAYKFLKQYARSQEIFTVNKFAESTGWQGRTPGTYLSKQLKSVVDKCGKGNYRVKRHFIHLKEEEFIQRTSQKESILPSYKRTNYNSVLLYEFLMPLTREDLLRQALDRLFFRNSLEEQIDLIGGEEFHSVIPLGRSNTDKAYISKVAQKVADYFGGYSILHASGRFRADRLLTQHESVGKRYIIDETTAIVRFIIPLRTTAISHEYVFSPEVSKNVSNEGFDKEISLVRKLFFTIFAEVVVHSVQGEDEIWLIESLNGNQRLYKWEVN